MLLINIIAIEPCHRLNSSQNSPTVTVIEKNKHSCLPHSKYTPDIHNTDTKFVGQKNKMHLPSQRN